MLRNVSCDTFRVLNELLNEVLSLNAQELEFLIHISFRSKILNEVLSLNAQEFFASVEQCGGSGASSMKS